MGKIDSAIREIHQVDSLASRDSLLTGIAALPKLLVTLIYIVCVVSFNKYDLQGVASMIVYPLVLMIVDEIALGQTLRRLRVVLLVVCAVGIANPFFDRQIVFTIGSVAVSGGVVSMITLILKGVFTVLAGFLLVSSTPIEAICGALRQIHVPKIFVTLILLINRYIVVLLQEGHRMSQAYALRAPGQKGIEWHVWGSFIGQMLLRSMDRAQVLYESMTLRGFDGEYTGDTPGKISGSGVGYLILWSVVILALRIFPVFALAGKVFVK